MTPADGFRTALVCGGSGYFGSRLVSRLLDAGLTVRIFDLLEASDRPSSTTFIRGDVRDEAGLRPAFEGVDVVFNAVAQVPLARDRKLFHSVNVTGTGNVLAAARRSGVRKLIHLSSSAVYGAPEANPVTESTIPAPQEAYGEAKLEGERLCFEQASLGLDVTVIRPRTILGHGRLGIFQILFEWVREGANIPVLGSGNNRYQFVHADDLAEACFLAARRPGATSFNCGATEFGTMRETLERLCAHAGTGSRVRGIPSFLARSGMRLFGALGASPLGPYHALMYGRSLYFDVSRARTELSWEPRFSNEAMIIQSYEWYIRNRSDVLKSSGGSLHRSPVKQGALGLLKWIL
ncbi:MAG TPA: NAD-dependent epimerase/dehydratase family protein [Planctomycetota bacterium]|jgi:nucleoside-diphosphate-sugar epimerase|nr:NAD-dependent epimerase/dehydratase family protein [Planctomycetota bacterium]